YKSKDKIEKNIDIFLSRIRHMDYIKSNEYLENLNEYRKRISRDLSGRGGESRDVRIIDSSIAIIDAIAA
ncbi:MAG: hypothetical protein AAF624_02900, partial [Bacteroidota bacterium]